MLKTTILLAVIVFVIVTLILVALLLFIKTKLTPSVTVKININEGSKIVEVTPRGKQDRRGNSWRKPSLNTRRAEDLPSFSMWW